jgi:RNA polymerase sigma factor (sigma-70 family)
MKHLLAKARAGDKASEEELFRFLSARFQAIAIQRIWDTEAAQDVAQEACATVFEKYRTETFTTSFEAWTYGVLRRKISNHLQSSKAERQRLDRSSNEGTSGHSSGSPEHELERRLSECLKRIGKANPRYARVLNLSYQGYKTKEICERLRISPNAMYSVLCRGRSLLKKCLKTVRV